MDFLNKLRERRIARIEEKVGHLNALLSGLDEIDHPEEYRLAELTRKSLWLKRSRLVKKLPPIYEGETHQ